MGYFAEAYWNRGWAGIFMAMIPLGAVFFAFGRYAQFVLQERKWLHFPGVFFGMFLGIRVDGSLVTEVFVSSLIALAYHFIANAGSTILGGVLPGRAARPSESPPGHVQALRAVPPPARVMDRLVTAADEHVEGRRPGR
jgi:hypothetical protein